MLETVKRLTHEKVAKWIKNHPKNSQNPLSLICAIRDLNMECIQGCVFGQSNVDK